MDKKKQRVQIATEGEGGKRDREKKTEKENEKLAVAMGAFLPSRGQWLVCGSC